MLDVGTKSGEVMTVSRDFTEVHVECLWVWVSIGEFWENLLMWLSLGERVLAELWELWREKGFRSVMGAKWRTEFLGSNLSLCPTFLLSDSDGKGMSAWSQCLFVNIPGLVRFLRAIQGEFWSPGVFSLWSKHGWEGE
jgi:hypothetical protein